MSIAPKALRQLRIISIPLTRPLGPKKSPSNDRTHVLTYYQFQITTPLKPTTPGDGDSWMSRWRPEGGFGKWVSTKVADTWASFGKAKGGWRLKTYQVGERLVDRMEFEELALKGIDPSLGPSVAYTNLSKKETGNTATVTHTTSVPQIPLVYPPSISSGHATLEELRELLAYRTPRHRRGFLGWMLFAPITAPFMIIPIIPNLPFFFCVWRSWSHYRAYRASQYLQSLLDSGIILPEASLPLDLVYKNYAPGSTSIETTPSERGANPNPNTNPSTSDPASSAHHTVLLRRDAVPAIISLFGLKPTALADLQRAVEQAHVRVQSGRTVL